MIGIESGLLLGDSILASYQLFSNRVRKFRRETCRTHELARNGKLTSCAAQPCQSQTQCRHCRLSSSPLRLHLQSCHQRDSLASAPFVASHRRRTCRGCCTICGRSLCTPRCQRMRPARLRQSGWSRSTSGTRAASAATSACTRNTSKSSAVSNTVSTAIHRALALSHHA